MHCLIRNAAVPGTAVIDRPWGLVSDDNVSYFFAFSWDHTTAGRVTALVANEAGGTARVAQLTTGLSADTWYAIGGTYDGTNIKAWLNGVAEATTACAAFGVVQDPKPSVLASRGGIADFDDSMVAEFAVWSDDLSATDMAILARGVSPLLVRPDILVVYWPLIRSIYALKGAAPSSANTTVAVHPPVTYAFVPTLDGWYSDVYDTSPRSAEASDTIQATDADSDETSGIDNVTVTDEATSGDQRGDGDDTVTVSDAADSKAEHLIAGRTKVSVGARLP